MQQAVKLTGDIEKLLSECSSQTLLKPDLSKMEKLAELVNSSPAAGKIFVGQLRTKLAQLKHQRAQLHLLELIEFLTVRCGQTLHNELNSKLFLQQYNGLFNQKGLSQEVADRALSLVVLWDDFFSSKKDILGNFGWYKESLTKRGIHLPPPRPSPYLSGKSTSVSDIPQQNSYQPDFLDVQAPQEIETKKTQLQAYLQASDLKRQAESRGLINQLADRELKLFNDLLTVYDNIILAQSLVDQRQTETLEEVLSNLQATQNKLSTLPEKLEESEEYFLKYFTMGINYDIENAIERAAELHQGNTPSPFDSQALEVVERFGQEDEDDSQANSTHNNLQNQNSNFQTDDTSFGNTAEFNNPPTNDPFA